MNEKEFLLTENIICVDGRSFVHTKAGQSNKRRDRCHNNHSSYDISVVPHVIFPVSLQQIAILDKPGWAVTCTKRYVPAAAELVDRSMIGAQD